ncbi:tail fiber assembly protein [Cronobacter sakazakii]|uniref:tail fiber assembly protein n=1 Tax=Cronobacter sakazakii TaxID=28141 RepID=UPI001BCB515D|nr:tail fiber assembly protein [Cronobacter sakazakii]EKK4022032.1 tail fiber assembly protein [Cronobacter sakazakii]EKK4071445.1 tail fiber assembly protein [Cronobacter sakazakii]EKK7684786.1 tail fiber assembly protein [Cronobacter sakazakii]MBS4466478.1 tail fiber assembly protein [Cronobacter sakazakii]MBS4471589.1 tail fiber assembly protein [Cronobacter sakazakii]
MKIWFSAELDAFFQSDWFTEQPSGTIEITMDRFEELMQLQSTGLIISHDKNGNPVAVEPPIPELTHDEQQALAENLRQELLAQADNVTADWRVELMLGDINEEDKSKLQKWMEYKRKVKEVDTSLAPDIDWPEPPED